MDHVVDRCTAAEHCSAIFQGDPPICPGFAEVDVQGFEDADHQRDSHQRILVELPSFRLCLPAVVGGGNDTAEQASSLGFRQVPFVGNFDERLNGARTQPFTLRRVR